MTQLKDYETCPKCGQLRFQHQSTAPGWKMEGLRRFKVVAFETWQCTNCQHIERRAGDLRCRYARYEAERDVWKANAETNLGELERANKEIDSLMELLRRERLKNERLQAALERKDYW